VPGFQNYFPSYEDFSCYFFSFCRLLWMYLMRSCQVPVIPPMNLSVRSVIWGHICMYIAKGGHFGAKCVKRHSHVGLIWRYTKPYIVGSSCFAVMSVISHSIIKVIWSHINPSILGRDRFAVTCVVNRTVIGVI
jgi:hypothetical protein